MRKKFLAMLAVVVALAVFAACTRPPEIDEDVRSLGNNTYEVDVLGWAVGGAGTETITVTVTFDSARTAITNVEVYYNLESQAWVNMITPWFEQMIVDYQSIDIDTVTDATVTSAAILEGVRLILDHTGIQLTGEPPTDAAFEPFVERVRANVYRAGTFGWAEMGAGTDYIEVTVTFDGNVMTDIVVNYNNESQAWVDMIHPDFEAKILELQSIDIDTVTDATVTSAAILKAIGMILEYADVTLEPVDPEDVNGYENGENGENGNGNGNGEEPPADPDPTPPANGGEVTPPPADPEPPAPPAGRFNPGTFTGSSIQTYSHNPNNEPGQIGRAHV